MNDLQKLTNDFQKLTELCLEKTARFQGSKKFLGFIARSLRSHDRVASLTLYKVQPRSELQRVHDLKSRAHDLSPPEFETQLKACLSKVREAIQVETGSFFQEMVAIPENSANPWIQIFPLRDRRKNWGFAILRSKAPFSIEQFFQLKLIFELASREIRLEVAHKQQKLFEVRSQLNALLQADGRKLEPIQLIAHSCPIISSFLGAERTTFFVYDPKRVKRSLKFLNNEDFYFLA